MTTFIKKNLTALLLAILGIVFVSWIHHFGLSTSEKMIHNCPLSPQKTCSMNINEHLNFWQEYFSAFVPVSFLLLLLLSKLKTKILDNPTFLSTKLNKKIISILLSKLVIHYFWLKTRLHNFSYNFFQILFSKGILHSKLH